MARKSLHLFSGWNQNRETSFKKKILFFCEKDPCCCSCYCCGYHSYCSCSSCCCDYSCASRCCLRRKVAHRSQQAWWSSRPPKKRNVWVEDNLLGGFNSNPLKNMSQNGNLTQIGVRIKKSSNHHLVFWNTPLKTATVASKNSTFLCFPGRHVCFAGHFLGNKMRNKLSFLFCGWSLGVQTPADVWYSDPPKYT